MGCGERFVKFADAMNAMVGDGVAQRQARIGGAARCRVCFGGQCRAVSRFGRSDGMLNTGGTLALYDRIATVL
jgi:hypothetical protein